MVDNYFKVIGCGGDALSCVFPFDSKSDESVSGALSMASKLFDVCPASSIVAFRHVRGWLGKRVHGIVGHRLEHDIQQDIDTNEEPGFYIDEMNSLRAARGEING